MKLIKIQKNYVVFKSFYDSIKDKLEVHFHKVKKGDTLQAIARKHHTTVDKLCKLNRIGKTIRLRPGQILKYN